MPLKLKPPRPDRTPYWYVRGTHLGVPVNESTGFTEKAKADAKRRLIIQRIESGALAKPGQRTFLHAMIDYIEAGGDNRFLGTYNAETGQISGIAKELGSIPPAMIDQALLDQVAVRLYPRGSAATRNRQVYTPVSAVLKREGIDKPVRRPKGWRGQRRTLWMTKEQAGALIDAAKGVDMEFAIFLTVLLYTGMRLSEALNLTCDGTSLQEAYAFAPQTKNGDPRTAYLPASAVTALANHPRGLERGNQKVFRFTKCGRIYKLLGMAKQAAGAHVAFVTFHVFRHTWATWMRRYGDVDTSGLVETGAWRDRTSAARYEHLDISEEARKADFLPAVNAW